MIIKIMKEYTHFAADFPLLREMSDNYEKNFYTKIR
jgi:hypothetical protein